MDEQVLFSSLNSNVAEMSSVSISTNRPVTKENAEISLLSKNAENKSLKKKTVNARKKISGNSTEQETDDAGQTSIGENTNDSQLNKNQDTKNRKRKAPTEEQSETESNGSVGATIAKDSEESKNNSGKIPKVKFARKERSGKVSEHQKHEVPSKTMDKSTRNNKENKRASEKSSTGKAAVHPPISEMVRDSFRSLRKRNGTSSEEICKYVEENFHVNINRIKPHIKKFLHKGVAEDLFDLMNSNGGDEKFKIKKAEKVNNKNGKTKMAKDDKKAGKIKKVAPRVRKETGKVKKVVPRVRKEIEKATRKAKNDKKVKPKKRVAA